MPSLTELADSVSDEATFLEFVNALRQDRLAEDREGEIDSSGRGKNGWQNHTIEAFLEAALAWAEDSGFGEKQGLTEASPWRKAAVFLLCGKIYE